jgi:hypothetical protein
LKVETVRRRSAAPAGTLQVPLAFEFEQSELDLLHVQHANWTGGTEDTTASSAAVRFTLTSSQQRRVRARFSSQAARLLWASDSPRPARYSGY